MLIVVLTHSIFINIISICLLIITSLKLIFNSFRVRILCERTIFGLFMYMEGEEEMHIQEIYLFAHKLFAMAEKAAIEQLSKYNLSISQCCLLLYIQQRHPEGTNITGLHRELSISKASLSEKLKKLRHTGYVEATQCESDERQKKIMISETAQEIMPEISDAMEEINNAVADKLTDKDMRLLKTIVRELQNIVMEVEQND